LALPREQLADKIADMRGFDLFRLDARRNERCFCDVAEQLEQSAAFALHITREIALRTAEDENVFRHVRLPFPKSRWPARALRCA
jgi:hypothetical protein